VVGTETIHIRGRRSQIERAIIARQVERSAVPTFVREWRSGRDCGRTFSTLILPTPSLIQRYFAI
jgi:hypothetical protein